MAKHHADWWSERVAEVEAGGDAARIAQRHQVTVKLLNWWRWKLRRTSSPHAERSQRTPSGTPRLLPVVVAEGAAAASATRDREPSTIVETSHGRISFHGPLSAEQLSAVVGALVGRC